MFSFFQSNQNSEVKRQKELIHWAQRYKVDLTRSEAIDKITKLDLSMKGIDKLPKQIDCLSGLEDLNLSNNQLNELPWEFRNLKNLKHLDLGFNRLKEISGVVCQLTQLQVLNMEANQLQKVTSIIANLTSLRELNLFANKIIELPNEFGSLKHLVRLNLAINQLSDLPSTFSKLYNIVELELWLNKFELIPKVISELPNLKDLYDTIDPEKLNKTLVWAIIGNNVQLAEKLIFYGANVNFELEGHGSKAFTTPLFEAKSIDMINLLLEKGADPNLKREIVKIVHTKEGIEEVRPTGQYETFLTIKHPNEIMKFIKTSSILNPELKVKK